jgi:hypothetical protein
LTADARQQAERALADAKQAIDEARREVHQAWRETRNELRHAWHEVSSEVREAVASDDDDDQPSLPPPASTPAPAACEEAEGLPVPIVPGTRVTEAQARPPVPVVAPARPHPVVQIRHGQVPRSVAPVSPAPIQMLEAIGLRSATEERAVSEARAVLQAKLVQQLAPEVSDAWIPPAHLVDPLITSTRITPINKDYGTIYQAELKASLSPQHRAELIKAYNREVVKHRLVTFGGSLAFVLVCLAVISGYIRADEATKGYYTRRLQMLAAAGVGAAGVILYNIMR